MTRRLTMSGRPSQWSRGRGTPVDQMPGAPPGQAGAPPGQAGAPPGQVLPPPWTHPRRRWGRRAAVTFLALLVLAAGLLVYVDRRLNRVDALTDYTGRPTATPGTDWLIVGSDSREGLTGEQKRKPGTGDAAGRRADTMMLLHIPRGGGQPTLVSLPRDSYVPIPGRGRNKLNAAYAFGGPKLLARTVEEVTGIRIDHYMEVGFDGFAATVDAVGGVRICPGKPMKDPMAGLNIPAGCQILDSRQALGYVRTRAGGRGDLDRVERQRELLGSLIDKATSPGMLLNPFRSIPLALDGTDNIAVDDADHLYHLTRFPLAMRAVTSGDGIATTVPIAGTGPVPGAGSVVRWDRQSALALFDALKQDRRHPSSR